MQVDLTRIQEPEAHEIVHQLVRELRSARDAVTAAERRVSGLRKMIDALCELYPAVEDGLPDDLDDEEQPRPRGAEAVRRVLAASRGNGFTVQGLVELLAMRGWLPDSPVPANAVRTSAERLVERGDVRKIRSDSGTVSYMMPAPSAKPPVARQASGRSTASAMRGVQR